MIPNYFIVYNKFGVIYFTTKMRWFANSSKNEIENNYIIEYYIS